MIYVNDLAFSREQIRQRDAHRRFVFNDQNAFHKKINHGGTWTNMDGKPRGQLCPRVVATTELADKAVRAPIDGVSNPCLSVVIRG